MLMLLLSLALAGVPDETWEAVEGQKVVLVNPQGQQIRGTIVGYEGDRVLIERDSDGRSVVVLKHEVSTVILVEPEPEETGVKDAIVSAGGLVKEAGEEVLDEVRPEDVPPPETEPHSEDAPLLEDDEVDEDSLATEDEPVLGVVDTVVVSSGEGDPEDSADPEEDLSTAFDLLSSPDPEATEGVLLEDDTPVILDTVIVSEPAPPESAELEISPVPSGRSYNEGYLAGSAAAHDGRDPLLAFAGGLCCTASMTAIPCAFSPGLGCLSGVVAGTASPAAAWLLDPEPPYQDLPEDEHEFSRGYVDGYTHELRRRRVLMAAVGSGSGLVVGGLTGFVIFSNNN